MILLRIDPGRVSVEQEYVETLEATNLEQKKQLGRLREEKRDVEKVVSDHVWLCSSTFIDRHASSRSTLTLYWTNFFELVPSFTSVVLRSRELIRSPCQAL